MKKPYTFFLLACLILTILGCEIIGGKDDDDDGGISPPSPDYPQAYAEPSVSPNGRKLLFVRNKVIRITKSGFFTIDPDSSGIWISESDGSSMKLLIQSQNVGTPSFSPDMKWILFEGGAQIYKVPFAGDSVEMDSLVQLTFEGRNFFPNWSPDGEWIAYDRSIEDETGPGGVWRMKQDGEKKESIFGGAFPDWHPNGKQIIGTIGSSPTNVWKRFKIYLILDGSTEILDAVVDANNLYPKYSPDGQAIAFQSDEEIWTMDATGGNLIQLTTTGGIEPAWVHNGNIVYINYWPHSFEINNGTIWIMNADGSEKRQLTYNYGLELEE